MAKKDYILLYIFFFTLFFRIAKHHRKEGEPMPDSMFASSIPYVMLVAGLILYFLPSLIAVLRDHPQTLPIFILDLLAAWTGIGWIVAVVWACTSFPAANRACLPPASDN